MLVGVRQQVQDVGRAVLQGQLGVLAQTHHLWAGRKELGEKAGRGAPAGILHNSQRSERFAATIPVWAGRKELGEKHQQGFNTVHWCKHNALKRLMQQFPFVGRVQMESQSQ